LAAAVAAVRLRWLLGLLLVAPRGAAAAPELWSGHYLIYGTARVPILGERETRTESFTLLEVTREPGALHLRERACRVALGQVVGVETEVKPEALQRLPPVDIALREAPGNVFRGRWVVRWPREDVDADGHPGLSISVKASICSGTVYVTSESETEAEARPFGAGWVGETRVRLRQEVLGASNACLRLTATDMEDSLRGVFRYAPVPPGSTCATLGADAWAPLDDGRT
jgi:hypothetical protein